MERGERQRKVCKDRLVFGQLFDRVEAACAEHNEHDEDDQVDIQSQIVRGVEKRETRSD